MEKELVIWTHAGKFHADEVSAIELIKIFHPYNVSWERSFEYPTFSEDYMEINKPTVIALDVGREFDGVTKFDHHHDPKLEAACVLAGEWLVKEGYLQERVWKELYMNLFKYISDVDTGKIPGGGDSYGFNALIRNLQCQGMKMELPQSIMPSVDELDFYAAVEYVSVPIIYGYYKNIKTMFEEDDNWPTFIKRDGIVEMGLEKCRRWKMFAKDEDVRFAVARNDRDPKEGIVLTYCQNKYPIVEDLSQTFLHNSKFFASYKTYEDAKRHAVEMAKMYKEKLELI